MQMLLHCSPHATFLFTGTPLTLPKLYRPAMPTLAGETTLRQLGDWSLHLQDYAGAASAHLMLASDLRPNKSGSDPSGWHQACAVLCAGLAQALGRKAWKDVSGESINA